MYNRTLCLSVINGPNNNYQHIILNDNAKDRKSETEPSYIMYKRPLNNTLMFIRDISTFVMFGFGLKRQKVIIVYNTNAYIYIFIYLYFIFSYILFVIYIIYSFFMVNAHFELPLFTKNTHQYHTENDNAL